ncbi:hypothetical protein NFI96_019422, partial [Prochilodus magdalenae]
MHLLNGSQGSADNHADSAQAIINQAMASYYDPNRKWCRILSPSSPRNPPSRRRQSSIAEFSSPTPRSLSRTRVYILFASYPTVFSAKAGSNEESRCGGVRIKTPTVKGILDLDKTIDERSSDSESAKYAMILQFL